MKAATLLSLLSAATLSGVGAFQAPAAPAVSAAAAAAARHQQAQQTTPAQRRRWVSMSAAADEASSESELEGGAAVTRRSLFAGLAAAVASSAVARPLPALAMSVDKFVQQMRSYGIKDTKPCPDGFSPVLEFYGKARQSTPGAANTDPLLITYNSPNGWLTVRPNIDNNGEDGTVSSGDYGKGDSASLFVYPKEIDVGDKDAVLAALYAGVTQKGASQVQGFKVKKLMPLKDATGLSAESNYLTFEYSYTLLTGAGFEIDRLGRGSIVSVAGSRSTQMMLGATTDIRYKKVQANLKEVADSFRVYTGVIPPAA